MKSSFRAGALLLVAVASLVAAPKPAAKPGKPGTPPHSPPAAKAPKRINDPGASVAQRLLQMTPEQRERALEKFPPERQAQIRQRLQRLDNLPPQQQQRLIQQYQTLSNLPPEKQRLVRGQIRAFNQLPDERKQVVGPELQRLRRMPEEERQARLASEEFKSKFTPAEQQMMSDVSQYLPFR